MMQLKAIRSMDRWIGLELSLCPASSLICSIPVSHIWDMLLFSVFPLEPIAAI